MHLPADGQDALAVLIESVARQASRGVQVWVLTREVETVDARDLASLFPDVAISVVPTPGSARTCWQGTPGGSPRATSTSSC